MTLPISGAISSDNINTEFNRTGSISFLHQAVLALAGKTAAPITIPGDVYGKVGKITGVEAAHEYGTGTPSKDEYISLVPANTTWLGKPTYSQFVTQWQASPGVWVVDVLLNTSTAALYTGQVRVVNNSTGVAKILTYAGPVNDALGNLTRWRSATAGSRDDTFMRVGISDSYVVHPYF
ncbi:hypothetical protein [Ralstonia sp. Ralssp135]|uniref:hypothetical protein n=1 Tax=Ralstonia sp. Ralssp135 TaxID=3243016 RepID=UPI0039B063FF